MNKLSVTVITLNEEKNIDDCLESVKELADEIIIVDSGSQDKTVDIAKKYQAKIYQREFDNFAAQKNYAVKKASGDWILSVDADEIVPKELANEIKKAIEDGEINGFLIPRRNFILDGEIKHSRWSPDKHIWLWRKNTGKWMGDVHEEVIVEGKVGELFNSKIHHSHAKVTEFFKSNNLYSQLQAYRMHKQGVKFSFWKMIWDAKYEFYLRYFLKLGFLDGQRGFILCYLMAIYKLTVWVKLWELRKGNDR